MEEIELTRCNVLGVGVHTVNMITAVQTLDRAVHEDIKGYVCVTGVHGVMESQSDETLRQTLNAAFLNVPDGMPLVWVGRLRKHKDMGRVYGPDLMKEICKISVPKEYTHFFYGGNVGIAEELKAACQKLFPGIKIVGTYTPPFRPLNEQEEKELIEQVAKVKPDFFWVGLSTPKQEAFMAKYLSRLDTKIMFGVGAAFDIHTGHIKDAPDWMKSSGLQWLHRLIQEPRRLAKRYLTNNPIFLWKIANQLIRIKKYEL
jgi:N-acetylglucosaminyldiphosphoundecaprenol N-acetyl-beta-D-mannosaminyltransferase